TRDEAIGYVLGESGKTYDPQVVATFLAHLPDFETEIEAMRSAPAPTFGIEAAEQLSEAALRVAPAAGIASAENKTTKDAESNADDERALYELSCALAACKSDAEKEAAFIERLAAVVPFDTCAL